VSKARARRRAEREAAEALARRRTERHRARVARTRAVRTALVHPVAAVRPGRSPRPGARRPVSTALGRLRARQNGLLLAVLVGAHTLLWLLVPSWWVRGSALVLTALAWPLLLVLFFDRRPTR
jgi:hypothetical protein